MNNDIKLLITAGLSEGSSITEINRNINQLQKKVQSLNLRINVDQNVLNQLNQFNTRMASLGDQALATKKVIDEVFLPDGTRSKRTYFDGVSGEFSETVEKAKQVKTSVEQTTGATKNTVKETNNLNKELAKNAELAKVVTRENKNGEKTIAETYKNQRQATQEVIKYNQHGEETGRIQTNNIAQRKKQEQEYSDFWNKSLNERGIKERQQIDEMASKRASAERKRTEDLLAEEKKRAQIINKRLDDEYAKKQRNNKVLDPYDTNMAIRQFDNRATEVMRQYPSVDKKAIAETRAEMVKMASTVGLTREQIQRMNMSLTETVTKTKQVTANTNTMAGALQNAMVLNFAV